MTDQLRAIKYSDDQPRDEFGRWSSGGGLSISSNSTQEEIGAAADKFGQSLTQPEKDALHNWGISGKEIRQLQNGTYNDNERHTFRKEQYEEIKQNWDSALDKAPTYEGVVFRGLSNVPMSAIDNFTVGESISLNNDQSATHSEKWATGFAGNGWADDQSVMMVIDQKSGKALMEMTNVTYGGRTVDEKEVVVRKGAKYEVTSKNYVDYKGKEWTPDKLKEYQQQYIDYYGKDKYSFDNLPEEYTPPWKMNRGYWKIGLSEK